MTLSLIVEMGWKSALISGVALLLVILLRSRSAADRAAVLRLAIALLLLLPFIALALPALQIEAPAIVEAVAAPQPLPAQVFEPIAGVEISPLPDPVSAETNWLWADSESLILALYLAGLMAIGLRLGTGVLTLRRWTAGARAVDSPEWQAAIARNGASATRLLVSKDVPAPLSWGWRNAVILIDEDTLRRAEDADAILAHEMAHVMRGDWIALVLARAAVALFWFNPLVWLMERQVAQQAEEAADCHALSKVEATRYAQTLVTCARNLVSSRVPANAIAPSRGALARRVKAILEGRATASGSRWTRIAMIGCAVFAAPVAALELIPVALPAAPTPPTTAVAALVRAPLIAASVVQPPQAPAVPVVPSAIAAVQTAMPVEDVHEAYYDEEATERAAEMSSERAERLAEQAEERAERLAEQAAERAERLAERAAERSERRADALGDRIDREVELATRHIGRDTDRAVAQAMRSAARAHAAGADSMMHGAEQMEHGAREMDRAAHRLRDAQYRGKQIADAARRGRRVTHEELIDSIPELRSGAAEMREGAAEMRRSAKEMRRQSL